MKSFKGYIKEASEIDAVIKAVGGGVDAEAVYETWVYIVANLSGLRTLPTSIEINKILKEKSDSEIVPIGRKWIKNLQKNTESDEFLLQAIELIGGDIKKVPNVPWGPNLEIIHKSVGEFYNETPDQYKEQGSKQNTADIVFVTKGTASGLLKALPNSIMTWDEQGKVTIQDKGIEFVQISLKKGQGSARIGKLNTLINNIYGQQAQLPSKMIQTESVSLTEEFLEEGFWDIVTSIKDKIVLGTKKFISWAAGLLTKIKSSIIKTGQRAIKRAHRTKIHKSMNNVLQMTSQINEISGDEFPINKPLMREMSILYNEIVKKDLVNKEYGKIVKNVESINSLEKEGDVDTIILDNKGTNPVLDISTVKSVAQQILTRKIGDIITRDELFPILKLSVNYASYLTFNTILTDVKSKVKDYKKVSKALVAFSAKLKSEAMFGNTLLPLYIVYGMGGGAHYKGTRNEFEDMTQTQLATRGKELDVPYMVLQISKTEGKKHNAIWALVLAGVQGTDKDIKPEYVKIQFINRSGSAFSYKIDASALTTKWK